MVLPLDDALINIANQRELKLAYAPELVENKTTSCRFYAMEDIEALKCILKDSGLVLKQIRPKTYIIQRESTPDLSSEKNRLGSLRGVVKTREDSLALPGAHVQLLGSQFATASGPNGTFVLDAVPEGAYELQISMMGYVTVHLEEVKVTGGNEEWLEIELHEGLMLLEKLSSQTRIAQDQLFLRIVDSVCLIIKEYKWGLLQWDFCSVRGRNP